MKKAKKLLAVLLAIITVTAIIPIATFTVSAASHTQSEAVQWICDRAYEGWWDDVDGVHGCQCVDLIKAYYNYFGYDWLYGNAGDYVSDHLPYGSNWYYSYTPIAGSIFVRGYSSNYSNGHVGLVYAVEGSRMYTVETNIVSPYDGGYSYAKAQFWDRDISFATIFINPTFANPHTHSYGAWQTVTAPTCTTAGKEKRVCSCGDTQTQSIPATGHKWNSGVVSVQPTCVDTGTKLFTCTSCKTTKTETIMALGHNYSSQTIASTCTEDAYDLYTCERCGDNYKAQKNSLTEWSTAEPPAGATGVQEKTQYRYKTKETSTGTSPTKTGWTTESETVWVKKSSGTHYFFARPNGFNNSAYSNYAGSAISASTTSSSKREVSGATHKSYIYWHWAYPYTYGNGGNTYIGDYYGDTWYSYDGAATVWEAFESNSDIREHTYDDGCVRVSGHSDYSYNWFITEVKQQTYTDYEKQYQYYKWSDWSDWQDANNIIPITTYDRVVETRTVYRYNNNAFKAKGHTPSNWITDREAQIGVPGSKHTECTVCHTVLKTETIPALEVIDENAPQIVIDSKKATGGKTVEVKLTLKNNPGVASLKLKVAYDNDLTLTEIAYNSEIGGNSQQPQALNSPVVLNWFNGEKDSNGDFVFATLTFKVSDNAAAGAKSISVTYNPDDVYNITENNIEFSVVNGGIDVTDYIPGDINGDGNVNNKDLTRLFQYLSEWDVEVNAAAIDVNGDGNTNNKDLTRLFQYLSEWDVEIF